MSKNKHKERAMQSLAQKAAKKSTKSTTTEVTSVDIAKAENEAKAAEETKVETPVVETPTPTVEEKPAEKVEEKPTPVEEKKEEPKVTPKTETKAEKKARQKAEYEAKKAEKKAAKAEKKAETAKTEEKPAETPKVEEKPIEKPAEKPVEQPSKKVEEAKIVQKPTEKKTPAPQVSTKVKNITAAIHSIANGDRMSANAQVQFLGLIKSEYLDNAANIPAEQLEAYRGIFKEGMAMNCLFLHEQIMREGREMLGIKLDDKTGPVLTQLLSDCWGITAKALPAQEDGQLRLEFEVPEDIKEAVVEDIIAVEEVAEKTTKDKEYPEPDANLPAEDKLKILRAILSQPGTEQAKKEGKDQMALNIYNGVEWARKAYNLEKDSPAQILAVMFEKLYKNEARPTALAGMSGRIFGVTQRYGNLLMAHAMFGDRFKFAGYADEQLAEMFKVLYAHHLKFLAGKNIKYGKPGGKDYTDEQIEAYLTEQGYEQLAPTPDAVVNAICNGTELKRTLKYLTDCNIDGKTCLTTIAKQYGDSESIAKEIVKRIAPYYTTGVERIAKYADMSSYSM